MVLFSCLSRLGVPSLFLSSSSSLLFVCLCPWFFFHACHALEYHPSSCHRLHLFSLSAFVHGSFFMPVTPWSTIPLPVIVFISSLCLPLSMVLFSCLSRLGVPSLFLSSSSSLLFASFVSMLLFSLLSLLRPSS